MEISNFCQLLLFKNMETIIMYKRNENLKNKNFLYSTSYMRLIIGLLYSLKLDKKDKYINRFNESCPNCLMPVKN